MNEDDVRRIVREEIKAMGSELVDTAVDAGSALVAAFPSFIDIVLSGMLGGFKPKGDDPDGAAVTAA